MPDPKRPFARLLELLTDPPAWLRLAAATLALVLAANLLYHGAQSYAVGLIPRPWDKLVHLAFFGGMAGLAWIVLGARGAGAHLGAIAVAVGIGVLDEVAQMRLPGRSVDVADFAADFVGAALGVLLLWAVRARRVRTA